MSFNDFVLEHDLKKYSDIKYKNTTNPFIFGFESCRILFKTDHFKVILEKSIYIHQKVLFEFVI